MKKVTVIFIILVTFIILGFDVFVIAADPSGESSISAVIRSVSHDWPILPFAIGAVCGHWFWPIKLIRYAKQKIKK